MGTVQWVGGAGAKRDEVRWAVNFPYTVIGFGAVGVMF